MADPDPEISGGPGLKKYFFWPQFGLKIRGQGQGQAPSPGSATEGSGPGRGKLELSNVRAVASQRFILEESLDIYTLHINRTITHVF